MQHYECIVMMGVCLIAPLLVTSAVIDNFNFISAQKTKQKKGLIVDIYEATYYSAVVVRNRLLLVRTYVGEFMKEARKKGRKPLPPPR